MKKSDLILPERGLDAPISKGSKVVFIDGSYTLSLTEGKLEHTCLGSSNDIFTVIAVNVPCPVEKLHKDPLISQNNCIVYNETDNSYHFCSEINIRNILKLGEKEPQLK